MRLTLVIDCLASGGAQRVMSIMANYWAARGWSITLLTLDDGREPPSYALNPRIAYRPLGTIQSQANRHSRLWNKFRHLGVLRSAIHRSQAQAVIAFLDRINILTLLATRGLGVPVIVSERVDPTLYPIGLVWETLRRWTYPWATAVVVQSEPAWRYFETHIRAATHVIPNPIMPPPEADQPLSVASAPAAERVLGIGRLERQKGFDILLRAFACLASAFPNWSLEIWGEGPERPALQKLILELGLDGRARLPGRTAHSYGVMQGADLFVLSSRFEGFPNVLCEAMASGLPVISFDCPSGPGDIIHDDVDGVLVPPSEEPAALAEPMARLMRDPSKRRALAARAPEVLERFGVDKVMTMWQTLIDDILTAQT